MLSINLPYTQLFMETTSTFLYVPAMKLELEHSLYTVATWESKWHKPFLKCLKDKKLTTEMLTSYVETMIQKMTNIMQDKTKHVSPAFLDDMAVDEQKALAAVAILSNKEPSEKIIAYLDDPQTATWFSKTAPKGPNTATEEIVTAEILYYDMFKLRMPLECEHWHLNRLLTQIRVFSEKDNPKKMNKRDILARNHSLNAQRRAQGKFRR